MEKSYTVKEIDELRYAVEKRWLYGTTYHPLSQTIQTDRGEVLWVGINSRDYKNDEKTIEVEQLLRTHMLAGHTAQDIYDADKPIINAHTKDGSFYEPPGQV